MTDKEKAKAYDEAIKRAQEAANSGVVSQNFVDDIFQLRESENERIRKALVIMMKVPRKEIFEAQGITKEQALAYLEKQKEQKESTNSGKPKEWSEEDEDYLRDVKSAVNDYFDEGYAEELCDWLKFLPERFNLEPKQEWSEEDDKKLELVIDCIYKFYPDPVMKYTLKDWLKSLRPPKDCSSCAKHLEGYISGRSDAENKLLEQFGALITPEDELRIKPRWKPSKEQMGALNYAYCELFKREDVGHNILGPLQNLIDTLRKL